MRILQPGYPPTHPEQVEAIVMYDDASFDVTIFDPGAFVDYIGPTGRRSGYSRTSLHEPSTCFVRFVDGTVALGRPDGVLRYMQRVGQETMLELASP